jgi:hypothetical protein
MPLANAAGNGSTTLATFVEETDKVVKRLKKYKKVQA